MITLTYDPKLISKKDAWEKTPYHWHRFITRLSIEMGIPLSEFHYVKVIESQENGYPHIHAVFLGIDWLYYAGNKQEWENDNPHSKNLKHFWKYGSIYINKTKTNENIENPINYLMKYIRKMFNNKQDTMENMKKRELTQSFLWAFNKRSFTTSRGLIEWLNSQKSKENIEWEWEPVFTYNMEMESLNVYEKLQGQKTPIRIVKIEPNVKGKEINESEEIPNPLKNKYSIARKIFLAHMIAKPKKVIFYSVDKQGNPIRYEYYECFERIRDYG